MAEQANVSVPWTEAEGDLRDVAATGDAALLDELPAVPEAFAVRGEDEANWVVRHIVQARARAARAKEFAAREVRRAEREEAFFMERFGGQLEAFAREQLAGGKRKSLALPAGTLAFRAHPARLVVEDEKAAIEWAKTEVPAAVVTVTAEKLDRAALSREFFAGKNKGMLPAGCEYEDAGDSFGVREK